LRISKPLHAKIFQDDKDLKWDKHEEELKLEDQDVKAERARVNGLKSEQFDDYPLVVKDIRKVYPGLNNRPPLVANKCISFRISPGELYGLLGPNGAGKTTLISQLTGMYAPTEGNAWIGGCSLNT